MMEMLLEGLRVCLDLLLAAVPEPWTELWLTVEAPAEMVTLGAYYRKNTGVVISLNPPATVVELCRRSREELIALLGSDDDTQGPWTSITAHIDSQGFFMADIGYAPLEELEIFERRRAWKKKYLS